MPQHQTQVNLERQKLKDQTEIRLAAQISSNIYYNIYA